MSQEKSGGTLIQPVATPTQVLPAGGTAIDPATTRVDPRGEPPAGGPHGDPFIGQELCGYTIRRKLAEGGMGVVYEGLHGKIGRTAAIKVLKLEYCGSEEVVERFRQEARAVNSIRHENIVDVYDFGRDPDGRVFFVMEYLEGEPLSARIRRGGIPWSEAQPILSQILRGLKAAHDQHFVHRDLKPDNIWLKPAGAPARVKLLDFGIAKLVGAETPRDKLTKTGLMIGTPHYMSPEQINGARDVDHRTDLYALGVIAYEMFAGVTPFAGDSLQAIMTGHLFKPPPRLADLPAALGVPAAIAEVIDRLLVKDAAGRYQSASEVLSDIQDLTLERPPARAEELRRVRPRRPPPPAADAAGPPRSFRRALILGGVLSVAVISTAGVAVWNARRTRPASPVAVATVPAAPAVTPAPPPMDFDALRARAQTILRASLHEIEPAVRVQGSDALGKVKDQPSVPALAELTEHDPDAEVRGHTAAALGGLGAASAAELLTRLEAAAPAPLKVWYASALARLGDRGAGKRLLAYAREKDLVVSFSAALMLADLSPPGDRKATAALKAIATREAELRQQDPYAGVTLATKLTALRDTGARQYLYALLDNTSEGARLAAAEGLARLGHDAGKKVLEQVLANQSSPNRLIAAVAQIPLGEYGGLEVMTRMLADKAPENRRLAARGLGDIADRQSLGPLAALAGDPDWTVRLAAARAIVEIVGLDPLVLARAAVDWTRSALDSQDLAVRRAAAGVLADIPATDAVPLLAVAIADADADVRRAASRSAGKMKSAAAAAKVADALKREEVPAVREQQVRALAEIGAIGAPAAHDTLAHLSLEPGRLGVLAAGSLIAVGDPGGNPKIEAAIAAPRTELRLAAVEAAGLANDPIVVPTLRIGLLDHVLAVRFLAALGLALLNAERTAAVPVLTAALDSQDAGVVGRALAGLIRFGEKVKDAVRASVEMLESPDPRRRLAVLPIVRELQPSDSVPLLRRLIADSDQEVRRAGVDAIDELRARDAEQAIRLYKPLVSDVDPLVRCKVSGRLSRLVPPAPRLQAAVQAVDTTPRASSATPSGADPALPQVQQALAEARAAADRARAEIARIDSVLADLSRTTAAAARDDATTEHVNELKDRLDQAPAQLAALAESVEAAARAASDLAGANRSPEAANLAAEAQALARRTRADITALRGRSVDAARKAHDFVTDWTGDAQLDIDAANAKIGLGDFPAARRLLDKAARQLRKSGAKNPALDYSYAQLFDKMAVDSTIAADKRNLLLQAADAYRRVARSGRGRFVEDARDRLNKIPDEIKELGPPP